MAELRKIRKVYKSIPTLEGAGVHLHRVFGNSDVPQFDPFLLLDDFSSDIPSQYLKGFPWHPHRGIETITYVLTGEVEHGDSLGNQDAIHSGDIQWMTAGSGIIHQEMPKGDARGKMSGFQLWANLPKAQKMMNPRYQGVKSEGIPEVILENGSRVKVICGKMGKVNGPVRDIMIEPEYLDVEVPVNATFTHSTQKGHTVFAYVFSGKGYFCREKNPFAYEVRGSNYFDLQRDAQVSAGALVLFDDGDFIQVMAENEPIRFLLVSGKPLGEPVAWYGPIVMNTRDELRTAIQELQEGTFVKYRG